tara:strand:+ start:2019 stop:2504 length:486 start_codon:yes stop_codon:yes gene_type:complete
MLRAFWYQNVKEKAVERGFGEENPLDSIYQNTNTVFSTTSNIGFVNKETTYLLGKASDASSKGRSRMCMHRGNEGEVQEIFIMLNKETNRPVSYHTNKDECLVVMQGTGEHIFPNEHKIIRESLRLAPLKGREKDKQNYYCRINRFVTHRIPIKSDKIVII